ncbi:Pfs domain protein [Beauveria bassiana ARSEF 2860]|uniref:Pfs domain protein n=1 Tax=Beauveria bassiana (strain ARSEF 2860) TaxID=655819 RepID=J4UIS9_BEAB2|nr:Pfs domain protein [Beauveria bassiana ARSEF 2860]EJP63552.1 Pfs domain protein [Beauveria bassiana ARSEF 2860]
MDFVYRGPQHDRQLRGPQAIEQKAHAKKRCLTEFPDEIILQMVDFLEREDASCLIRTCHRFLSLFFHEYHRYDNRGRNLLIIAAALGHLNSVLELLSAGIDTAHKDKFGRTALLCAAGAGRDAVVQLLLKVGVPTVEPADELTYRLSTFQKLDRQAAGLAGHTPLSEASRNGHELVVKVLLADPDVNPNHQDGFGRTALALASSQGRVAAVQALLSHEAIDADRKDVYGNTPLASAATNGHVDVVMLLLAHTGVERDSTGWEGKTPLLMAAQMRRKEVVRHLLAAGADPTLKDARGLSPIDLAEKGDESLKWPGPDERLSQRAVIRLLRSAIAAREPKAFGFRCHFIYGFHCFVAVLSSSRSLGGFLFWSKQRSSLGKVSGASLTDADG